MMRHALDRLTAFAWWLTTRDGFWLLPVTAVLIVGGLGVYEWRVS